MILTCKLKFICNFMINSFQYDERDYSEENAEQAISIGK